MALTATTLSGAITSYANTNLPITSTTGATAPVFTTGSGYTFAACEAEMMFVTAVPSTTLINVVRGVLGTRAVSHVSGAQILFGGTTDFPNYVPQIGTWNPDQLGKFEFVGPPVAAAATIVASGAIFHVTGTTATNIITPPTGFTGGVITIIADGVWTFTVSSTVANGIAATGTVTSAGTAVQFVFDQNTALWYPLRRA